MNNEGKIVKRIEEDPIARSLSSRPAFIPLRHYELRSVLQDEFQMDTFETQRFKRFCRQLQTLFHVEHQSSLRRLEELYEQLDPDSHVVNSDIASEFRADEPKTDLDTEKFAEQLIDIVSGLLYSAHYKRLSEDEIKKAVDVGWNWGVKLDVNFELFDRLEIFARGYRKVTITRRRWQNFFLLETIELPEFTRLIMAFRIKPGIDTSKQPLADMLDSRYVYLKTFKNIPETDVEILLPGTKVRLTKIDRAKILFPTVSGMAITGYKLFRSILLLGLAFSWKTWFGFAVLVGGGIGYIVKSVLSYFRTKKNYQFGLTQNLYVKNLDNNLSVLYRILNEAEEQEVNEVVLAYTILWKHPDAYRGIDSKSLDQLAEVLIKNTTKADVDFEIHDALGKLARLGLANVDANGKWHCLPMEQVEEQMNDNWQNLFQHSSRQSSETQ